MRLSSGPTRMPPIPNHSRAFTLVELLLVLALLVVIAGLSVAALDGSLLKSRLRGGVEQVRTAWADARTQSATGGERLAFTCLIGGRDYRLSSISDLILPDESAQEATSQTGELPEGIKFAWLEAAPTGAMQSTGSAPPPQEGQWSPPVVFNPDGTSYDAIVTIEDQAGQQIQLSLRGLTCSAFSNRVVTGRLQ